MHPRLIIIAATQKRRRVTFINKREACRLPQQRRDKTTWKSAQRTEGTEDGTSDKTGRRVCGAAEKAFQNCRQKNKEGKKPSLSSDGQGLGND